MTPRPVRSAGSFSSRIRSFGIGALAGWDGDGGSFWRFPSASSRHVFVGVAGATTILFLYLIPISYGWEISAAGMLHRRWILERHIGVSPDS